MKLDIGGGTHKCDPGFVAVDMQGGDVTANMWELPFKDGSVEFIWASHTLEHSGIHLVDKTLKEWVRVLEPGGWAVIQVPNFDYVARYWIANPESLRAQALVFGHQKSAGEFHKCAFSATSLRMHLEGAGFLVAGLDIVWNYDQETIRAICVKEKR